MSGERAGGATEVPPHRAPKADLGMDASKSMVLGDYGTVWDKRGHFYYRQSTHNHWGIIYFESGRLWRRFLALLIKLYPWGNACPNWWSRIDPAHYFYFL